MPLCYSNTLPSGAIDAAFRCAYRVWPVASISYKRLPMWVWCPSAGCQQQGPVCLKKDLKQKLTTVYRQANGADYIFGWLSATIDIGALGSSDPTWAHGDGKAAFAVDDRVDGSRLFAHEMAHLMGRRHTRAVSGPACGNLDPASDWPYETALIQEWGVDSVGLPDGAKDPNKYYDYMSYCWIQS